MHAVALDQCEILRQERLSRQLQHGLGNVQPDYLRLRPKRCHGKRHATDTASQIEDGALMWHPAQDVLHGLAVKFLVQLWSSKYGVVQRLGVRLGGRVPVLDFLGDVRHAVRYFSDGNVNSRLAPVPSTFGRLPSHLAIVSCAICNFRHVMISAVMDFARRSLALASPSARATCDWASPSAVATFFLASAEAWRNSFSTRMASCVALIFALMASTTFCGRRIAPMKPNCSIWIPNSSTCAFTRLVTSLSKASFPAP